MFKKGIARIAGMLIGLIVLALGGVMFYQGYMGKEVLPITLPETMFGYPVYLVGIGTAIAGLLLLYISYRYLYY